MQKQFLYIFIFLFCLSSFSFYNPVFLNDKITKYSYYVFLAIVLAVIVLQKNLHYETSGVRTGVQLVVFAIFFSIFPAYFSWNQDYVTTFLTLPQYLPYLLFFFLLKYDIDLRKLEKVIVAIGLLTSVIYIVSFFLFPRILFGGFEEDDIDTKRGFARIAIAGLGFVYLAYFLALNKIVTDKKPIWFAIAGFTVIAVLLTLTRQTIFSCALIGMLFLMRKVTLFNKIVLLAAAVAVVYFVVPQLPFMQILLQQTQEQAGSFTEDIRYLCGRYFLIDFSPDWFARIFGNGEANIGKSDYGDTIQQLKDIYRFYQSDVGFIGFYSKFGLVGIIGWIVLFWKVFTTKFPEMYLYVPMFILLVLLTGFTSSMPFNASYMASIAIALYLAERNRAGTIEEPVTDA
jgi:hypothetical protein